MHVRFDGHYMESLLSESAQHSVYIGHLLKEALPGRKTSLPNQASKKPLPIEYCTFENPIGRSDCRQCVMQLCIKSGYKDYWKRLSL